ncbi:MAG: hypothetical protein WCS37_02200 [Chloroflexota bacterium]
MRLVGVNLAKLPDDFPRQECYYSPAEVFVIHKITRQVNNHYAA